MSDDEYHEIKTPKLTDLEYQFIENKKTKELSMILALVDSNDELAEYVLSEKTLAKLIDILTDCHKKIAAINKSEEGYVIID